MCLARAMRQVFLSERRYSPAELPVRNAPLDQMSKDIFSVNLAEVPRSPLAGTLLQNGRSAFHPEATFRDRLLSIRSDMRRLSSAVLKETSGAPWPH